MSDSPCVCGWCDLPLLFATEEWNSLQEDLTAPLTLEGVLKAVDDYQATQDQRRAEWYAELDRLFPRE